jgi:hypothetical protein
VIENVCLTNNGGLTLPSNTSITLEGIDAGFCSENTTYVLPIMKPGAEIVLKHQFFGKISADKRPKDDSGIARLDTTTTMGTRAILLARTFNDSLFMQTIQVRYPVRIEALEQPELMGHGQMSMFRFSITNISTRYYGSHVKNSMGSIRYKISIHPKLVVFDDNSQQITVIEGDVNSVTPQSTEYIIQFQASMALDAELFDRLGWQVELYLRDELIETRTQFVRVAPTFIPMNDANKSVFDVLFVTDKHLAKREFDIYSKALQVLGMMPNYWDIERYGPLGQDNATWVDHFRGKTILIPALHPGQIFELPAQTMLSHFISQDGTNHDSSIVIIGWKVPEANVVAHLMSGTDWVPVDTKQHLQKLMIKGKPKSKHIEKKCETFKKKCYKLEPSRHFSTYSVFYQKKVGRITHELGSAYMRRLPIPCTERLLVVLTENPLFLGYNNFDSILQSVIPFASKFHYLVYALVQSLSVPKKLKLLAEYCIKNERPWSFVDDTKGNSTMVDLIKATLYRDMVEEFIFPDLALDRTKKVVEYILNNIESPAVDILWCLLARLERRSQWKGWSILQKLYRKREVLKKLRKSVAQQLFSNSNAQKVTELKNNAKLDADKSLQALQLWHPLMRAKYWKKLMTMHHTLFDKRNLDF